MLSKPDYAKDYASIPGQGLEDSLLGTACCHLAAS